MIRKVMTILKKSENALLEKILKSNFQLFFFSNCQIVIPYTVSNIRKDKNVLYIYFKSETYFYMKLTSVH